MIKHEKPAIYETLKEKFNVHWEGQGGCVISYFPHIYSKHPIPLDLEKHEEVHLRQQQEMGVEKWWETYINNKNFRLLQEVEAYKAQIEWINKAIKDREVRFRRVDRLLKDLSGEMYGSLITYSEARKLLGINKV